MFLEFISVLPCRRMTGDAPNAQSVLQERRWITFTWMTGYASISNFAFLPFPKMTGHVPGTAYMYERYGDPGDPGQRAWR
jgi:hypothetical protein